LRSEVANAAGSSDDEPPKLDDSFDLNQKTPDPKAVAHGADGSEAVAAAAAMEPAGSVAARGTGVVIRNNDSAANDQHKPVDIALLAKLGAVGIDTTFSDAATQPDTAAENKVADATSSPVVVAGNEIAVATAPVIHASANGVAKSPSASTPHLLSAGQLCDLRTRPVHVASRTAICGFSTISDDATALR